MYKEIWNSSYAKGKEGIDSEACPQSGRSGHCSWLHNGKLYVFGGSAPAQTNDLYVFDTNEHKWSKPKTSGTAPTPRTGACAAVVGNSAVVFGGVDEECPTMWTNDTYVLNMSTMRWTKASSSSITTNTTTTDGSGDKDISTPPSIRDKAACCSFIVDDDNDGSTTTTTTATATTDTLFCVFGGFAPLPKEDNNDNDNDDNDDDGKMSFGWLNDIHCFDISTMKWTKYSPANTESEQPTPRCATSLCAISDKSAVLFGGRTSTEGRTNDMWRMTLNTADKTVAWERMAVPAPLPPPRSFHTMSYLRASSPKHSHGAPLLVLHGGISAESVVLNDTWAYNTEAHKWDEVKLVSDASDVVPPRSFHTACSLLSSSLIYIYGGENNFDEDTNSCTNLLNSVAVIEPAKKEEVML